MISIYFDESGNTGSIKKRGSYDSQPYFAYSAYAVKNEDKLNTFQKYKEFIDKYKDLQETTGEIKGNILLTKRANEALEYFIDNFVNEDMFINIYSKDYYISTLFCFLLLGQRFQLTYTTEFYTFAGELSKEKKFIESFIRFIEDKTKEKLNNVINIVKKIDYVQNKYFLNKLLTNILQDDIVMYIDNTFEILTTYENPNLENVVNIPCFGELYYIIEKKIPRKNITKIQIDRIEQIDNEITSLFKKVYNKEVIVDKTEQDKLEKTFLDISDNIVSIFLKLCRRIWEDINSKNLTTYTWEMTILKKIIDKVSLKNIKLTVRKEEYIPILAFYNMQKENLEFNSNNISKSHCIALEKWEYINSLESKKLDNYIKNNFNLW